MRPGCGPEVGSRYDNGPRMGAARGQGEGRPDQDFGRVKRPSIWAPDSMTREV